MVKIDIWLGSGDAAAGGGVDEGWGGGSGWGVGVEPSRVTITRRTSLPEMLHHLQDQEWVQTVPHLFSITQQQNYVNNFNSFLLAPKQNYYTCTTQSAWHSMNSLCSEWTPVTCNKNTPLAASHPCYLPILSFGLSSYFCMTGRGFAFISFLCQFQRQ